MNEQLYGWPVVTAENCFNVVRECGIKPWEQLREPVALANFLATATDAQRQDYERFCPKTSVVTYHDPINNKPFEGFTTAFKPYACVFTLIDGKYVAVTAEWKHGNGKITFVPVCGVPGKAEAHIVDMLEKMAAVAMREHREETGFTLSRVFPLSPATGLWTGVRNSVTQCYPFLGEIDLDTPKGSTKFDDTEHIQMVLFELEEWLKFVEDPRVFDGQSDATLETVARDTTYAALRAMGRLKLV